MRTITLYFILLATFLMNAISFRFGGHLFLMWACIILSVATFIILIQDIRLEFIVWNCKRKLSSKYQEKERIKNLKWMNDIMIEMCNKMLASGENLPNEIKLEIIVMRDKFQREINQGFLLEGA